LALSFTPRCPALVGGIVCALSGGLLSLGSWIGFITVLGISARNGIMLISHCRHLEREEGMSFGRELVLRGATERVTPILMTTLTTCLALLPIVATGDRPGHEIEHPMRWSSSAVFGGSQSADCACVLCAGVAEISELPQQTQRRQQRQPVDLARGDRCRETAEHQFLTTGIVPVQRIGYFQRQGQGSRPEAVPPVGSRVQRPNVARRSLLQAETDGTGRVAPRDWLASRCGHSAIAGAPVATLPLRPALMACC
jgi:hypothetical protein